MGKSVYMRHGRGKSTRVRVDPDRERSGVWMRVGGTIGRVSEEHALELANQLVDAVESRRARDSSD